MEMEEVKQEPEELEVTVDVVPQTVTEIIYLREGTDETFDSTGSSETSDNLYQIGSVDIDRTNIDNCSLVLDQSTESVVLLTSEYADGDTIFLKPVETHISESEDNPSTNFGLGEYICSVCNFKCRSLSSLTSHRLLHKSNFSKCQYTCKVCGQNFLKAQTLSHHFRVNHETPKVRCTICGCYCAHEMALQNHYKTHEPKQYSCDKCEAEYNNVKDLENHKKTHVTDLLYACNKCGAGFSSTAEVSTHLRMVHAKQKHFILLQPGQSDYGNVGNLGTLVGNYKVEIDRIHPNNSTNTAVKKKKK